jgi:phosphoribosylformylglycinamidine synthase
VHDCSDGGLAVALAEMAIAGEAGFTVAIGDALACFSESASRVVLSVAVDRVDAVLERAAAASVPAAVVGEAGGDELVASGAFRVGLADATRAWRDAIPSIMGATVR